jgi:serine/threonine-protein kinase
MQEHHDLDVLLVSVLEQPAAERARFLDSTCGMDAALRSSLDRLLRELDENDPFLRLGGAAAGVFGDDLAAMLARDEGVPLGDRIGPYRIVGELGRGGMAVVYLADRVDGAFDQQVALKIVKRGIDTDEVLTRFRQERQILASLTHPGIARLLDGGETPDGRPYLVMELVHGDPIHRYCQREGLDLEARVDLCIAVAQAVQHAHRHLVVHRDLKPSNILITAEGGVRLLDFGIAKLLDTSPVEFAAPHTRTAIRVMTPDYASPEQVRGGPITTGSDVYQLGLILFELLTGRRAQSLDGRSAAEAERVVCQQPPQRPSVVAQDDPAARRQARLLQGDLDNIVLKALNKEVERRYGSVDELLDDLVRYRRGLPVGARGDTFGYRAAKFLRRHRHGVAAASAVAVLVAGLVTFYSVRLARERDTARLEAAAANEVAGFVGRLFESSDPLRARGENLTARQLLDRGAARIEAGLADQPEVQARLMMVIGASYDSLGVFEPAARLYGEAVASRRARLSPADPALAASLHSLGIVLYKMGRYEEARPLLEEALQIRETVLGAADAEVGSTLDALALLSRRLSQLDAARDYGERALGIRRRALGPTHEHVARSLNNLGLIYQTRGDYEAAVAHYEQALAIHEKNGGPDHPHVASTTGNLGEVKRMMGDLEGAEPLLSSRVAIFEKTLGSAHPDTGTGHNSLGSLYYAMERYDDAQAAFTRAQEIYTAALGPTHPTVAYPIENLGNIYKDLDDYERALAQYAKVYEIRVAAYGPVHNLVAQVLANEALVWRLRRDWPRAESALRRSLDIYRQVLPPAHPRMGVVSFHLGSTLAELARYAEAEPFLLAAYPILRDTRGPTDRFTTGTAGLLASIYEAWGKPDKAEPYRALEKNPTGGGLP